MSKRFAELREGHVLLKQMIASLRDSKQGDVPLTIKDKFEFLLKIFDDLDALYLSNMALISQFKQRAQAKPAIDD
jgi:hypothetical protein